MPKRIALALAVLMISLTMPATAAADARNNNPNILLAEDLDCNGGPSGDYWIISRVGHQERGAVGVAAQVEIEVAPDVWVTLWEVPGVGLQNRTTHCTWTVTIPGVGEDIPARGDIIIRGNLR